ncbi:hypothetical protein EVC45_12200 [Paraburkholderia sp. UYCP14C]|nr:hypothetical protein EVC45_12200 [Paraburkholderia sp. UYCP14C]
MNWVIIFVGVWVIALVLLLLFAARIDPRSGRWRRRQVATPSGDAIRLGGRAGRIARRLYCLQRMTIERFFTLAPKIPPTVPPDVPPLSTSFEITS